MSKVDLGFDLVRSKERPYWHRKNDADGADIGYPVPPDGDDEDIGKKEKTDYPSFFIEDAPEELEDLEEEGECVVKYRVVRRTVREISGEDDKMTKKLDIELDIMSIEPKGKASYSDKSSPRDKVKKAMDDYRSKK